MLYSTHFAKEGTTVLKRLFTVSLLLAMPLAGADTLLLDGIDTGQPSAHMRPTRGMSMDAVQSAFGSPSARQEAVGAYSECRATSSCPPITRWNYPGFVVYFEYEHVIHAVSSP